MAHARDAARTFGKSDPIDALAVARAALREPNLPTAHLDAPSRELRLLVDHREDLIAERTRHINRLRWHLHEIDPEWDPSPRCLTTFKHLRAAADRLTAHDSVIAQIATDLVTGSTSSRSTSTNSRLNSMTGPKTQRRTCGGSTASPA